MAVEPATRCSSPDAASTNFGSLTAGTTRLATPTTVPVVPSVQPGDTQFLPNVKFCDWQYANFSFTGLAPGVRGRAAKMLLRASMMPGGAVGGQSYAPYVLLKRLIGFGALSAIVMRVLL